ncbi:MAG: hypothetical protein KA535_05810 [Azonexus sp.]|nr:hypothetical protein [Azonexus sp.]
MKTTVFPPDDGYDYFNASPAQVAARASSLIVAARLITNGDSLCDKRFAESICDDLLDVAAWLARQLENYHDDLEQASWKPKTTE